MTDLEDLVDQVLVVNLADGLATALMVHELLNYIIADVLIKYVFLI